jgi:hypothetical protein
MLPTNLKIINIKANTAKIINNVRAVIIILTS